MTSNGEIEWHQDIDKRYRRDYISLTDKIIENKEYIG